tara:strand:- start:9435 stop:10154 length:720 start_codon:yes stop_codon:yes gene_type:complete
MTKPAPTILTREDLHAGTGVRISIPKLGVFEGPIEKPDDQYRRGYPDSIMVAGVRLNPASHDVEFVADADLTPGRPAVLEPTAEQVIKAVEDTTMTFDGKPHVRSTRDILTELIGFDAAGMLRGKDFGGKTVDGWFNQFIKVSATKRMLDTLTADGSIVKVNPGNRFTATPDYYALHFGDVRSGYVTAAAHAQAHAALVAKQDEARIAQLRIRATATVAARHQDEIETELARLLAEDAS